MSSFWDRYKHYDPSTEGFGSADEWIKIAEKIAGGRRGAAFANSDRRTSGSRHRNPKPGKPVSDPRLTADNERDLRILFLEEFPPTEVELKRAFRNSLFVHHPDYGGSNEKTIEAMAAFDRLLEFY